MQFKEKAITICKNFATDGLYILPSIPEKKLDNATEYFPIDESDEIFGLIDSTVFGSCKTGLAFGLKGIYWKNDWTTNSVDSYLSWGELSALKDDLATKIGSTLILGPGNAVNFSGSSVKNRHALKLLLELIKLYEESPTSYHQIPSVIEQHNLSPQAEQPNYAIAIIKLAAVYATAQELNEDIVNLCIEYISFDDDITDKVQAISLLQKEIESLMAVSNVLKKLQISKIIAELKQSHYSEHDRSHINIMINEFNQITGEQQILLDQL